MARCAFVSPVRASGLTASTHFPTSGPIRPSAKRVPSVMGWYSHSPHVITLGATLVMPVRMLSAWVGETLNAAAVAAFFMVRTDAPKSSAFVGSSTMPVMISAHGFISISAISVLVLFFSSKASLLACDDCSRSCAASSKRPSASSASACCCACSALA